MKLWRSSSWFLCVCAYSKFQIFCLYSDWPCRAALHSEKVILMSDAKKLFAPLGAWPPWRRGVLWKQLICDVIIKRKLQCMIELTMNLIIVVQFGLKLPGAEKWQNLSNHSDVCGCSSPHTCHSAIRWAYMRWQDSLTTESPLHSEAETVNAERNMKRWQGE